LYSFLVRLSGKRGTSALSALSKNPDHFALLPMQKQRANKQNEKREYTITWVKKGVKFEHFYPNYEGIKELQF
jgi:hypothetical protein